MNYFEYVFSNLTYVLVFFGAIALIILAAIISPYVCKLLKFKNNSNEPVKQDAETGKNNCESPKNDDGENS